MTAPPHHEDPGTRPAARPSAPASPSEALTRIAVGVDGYPEGRDAVALGRAIAHVTGAELMLVAVQPEPLVVLPPGMDSKSLREQAEKTLREVRHSLAPDARIVVETDLSVARALHRVVRREHRDLLVLGSSRHAGDGRVRAGKRARQLLCSFECALAVAPRGMHARPEVRFRRIGVGYDGGPESDAALAVASSIALAAEAELHVRAVVDDRVPVLLRSALGGLVSTEWRDAVQDEKNRLEEQARAAAHLTSAAAQIEILCGRPAEALLALSRELDLLVIGSRRWGPAARVLLGSSGEALLRDGACAVMAVPRPAA
jgi:nucleotide-binding universal stress UspA family protein